MFIVLSCGEISFGIGFAVFEKFHFLSILKFSLICNISLTVEARQMCIIHYNFFVADLYNIYIALCASLCVCKQSWVQVCSNGGVAPPHGPGERGKSTKPLKWHLLPNDWRDVDETGLEATGWPYHSGLFIRRVWPPCVGRGRGQGEGSKSTLCKHSWVAYQNAGNEE